MTIQGKIVLHLQWKMLAYKLCYHCWAVAVWIWILLGHQNLLRRTESPEVRILSTSFTCSWNLASPQIGQQRDLGILISKRSFTVMQIEFLINTRGGSYVFRSLLLNYTVLWQLWLCCKNRELWNPFPLFFLQFNLKN